MTLHEIHIDEIEDAISMIEENLLPEQETFLAYLTAEDYDPAGNPDDDCRESDIEYCHAEIAELTKELTRLQRALSRLQKKQEVT